MRHKSVRARIGALLNLPVRKVQATLLALLCAATSSTLSVSQGQAAEQKKLRLPSKVQRARRLPPPSYQPDILLVMPNSKADGDEVSDILKDVHGQVVGSIGEGRLKCLIVKTEKGQLEETEKKLTKDKKHFTAIGRNYRCKAQITIPNDPVFRQQWHLGAINAPRAWDRARGGGVRVGILDTGCQASIDDLTGKTARGYDATTWAARMSVLLGPGPLGWLGGAIGGAASGGAQTDVDTVKGGHGTACATTAAGTFQNLEETAGVAPNATVYPVQVAGSGATTDDVALMAAFLNLMTSGCRVVNISYGAPPPFHFTNAAIHGPLHIYMAEFHTIAQGLIFMSAGNDAMFNPDPPAPYLEVVSAVDQNFELATWSSSSGSNWGPSTTFTAPGSSIWCSDKNGVASAFNGTSLASPICAGIAALILSANPLLTAPQVKAIMIASCARTGIGLTPYYGFGMPDAELAVRIARGGF